MRYLMAVGFFSRALPLLACGGNTGEQLGSALEEGALSSPPRPAPNASGQLRKLRMRRCHAASIGKSVGGALGPLTGCCSGRHEPDSHSFGSREARACPLLWNPIRSRQPVGPSGCSFFLLPTVSRPHLAGSRPLRNRARRTGWIRHLRHGHRDTEQNAASTTSPFNSTPGNVRLASQTSRGPAGSMAEPLTVDRDILGLR